MLVVEESGDALVHLPVSTERDFWYPLLLQRFHLLMFGGLAWQRATALDMVGDPNNNNNGSNSNNYSSNSDEVVVGGKCTFVSLILTIHVQRFYRLLCTINVSFVCNVISFVRCLFLN